MIKKILNSLELVIYSVIWYLLLQKYPMEIPAQIPIAKELPLILTFCILILFYAARFKTPTLTISALSLYGLSVLTLSTEYLRSNPQPFPFLFYVVLITATVLGKIHSWVIPFSVFFFNSLFFSIIYHQYPLFAVENLYPVFGLIVCGLFPSLLKNHPLPVTTPLPNTAKRTEDPVIEMSAQNVTEQANPYSAHTQTFVIDTTTDVKEEHDGDVDEILSSVVYFMSRNFKAFSSLAFIYDSNSNSFILNAFHSKSKQIAKKTIIPLGKGIIGEVGSEKRSFMSGNLPLYRSEILYYKESELINSLLAVPILSEQNELMGALVLDSIDKQAFKDQDKEILKRFSVLAAALINNARMRIFQEKTAKTFQLFYQASHNFSTALKQENVFDVLLNTIPLIIKCTRQLAIIFEEETKCGYVLRTAGINSDIPVGFRFPINSGLYSFVFQKRKPVILGDFQQYQSKYFRFVPGEPHNSIIRSLAIYPIVDDENRCRGIVSIESNEPNQFDNDTDQILAALLENASVAFTRAILYQHMERLATTDGLTGLNNHRHFQEILSKELERSRRYGRPLSLLLMDIDHFKTFNDTYGHPVGDLVLKEISLCIRKSIRINDIPARYGGEEFTVIIPETDSQGASVIAERVRTTIEKHVIRSFEKQLHVTVSIGCATFPNHAKNQQEIIDNADKALYYSKEHGRNRITIYSSIMVGTNKKF